MKTPKTYLERKEAAFQAGLRACREGKALEDCPIRKHQGLRRSWSEGWQSAASERQQRTSGMFIARLPPVARPALAAHG